MELIYILTAAGAAGGLIKSLVEQKGAITLPSIELAPDGTKYVHLGFVANIILGAAVAVYSADTAATAVFAGISSAFLMEKLLERAKYLPLPGKV